VHKICVITLVTIHLNNISLFNIIMKKIAISFVMTALGMSLFAQVKVGWVATSQTAQWKEQKGLTTIAVSDKADVEVLMNNPLQAIDGFGTCFNELGWTSLSILSAKDREGILRELFAPRVGANFTICRMPVGANDFSRNWYSYNETDGDFDMKNFTIARDMQALIPFIKSAQKYNPSLKLWASPWSPPTWMKYNKHYALKSFPKTIPANINLDEYGIDFRGRDNGLKPEEEGAEGTNMFIQEDKYFKAYALYFARFIKSYKEQNIYIGMVMPQNEFNSAQVFPSCTWTAAGLARFISYLGPQMQSLDVSVFFGTMERANEKLVDTILNDRQGSKYIKGVGFQWAGKEAIAGIHKRYPELTLYQTEQECGNGKNDWKYCVYTLSLMKHYFSNGAKAYMYWNTSLKQGGISTWGWKQNSLVSIDTVNKMYKYNYEYYLMKHLSHYVLPGAKRLQTSGDFNNLLAFLNKDKSIVVMVQNDSDHEKVIRIKVGNEMVSPSLKADSFNTLIIKRN
jgi:glucosylceramidase